MVEGNAERRLAAIVAIDVAGYSRLMGADEDGTLAAMKGHREAAVPIGEKHGGRMVGTAGDGELWEFPSVTEAIASAIEIQALLAERNTDIPDDRKMLYRIGINLGDVMIDGDEIYGEGINVAARLEALAEPGSICVSRMVRDGVRDRTDVAFEDMGEIEVKNISRPVRVFRVLKEGEVAKTPSRSILAKPWTASAAAIVLLLVIAGGGTWWWQSQLPDFTPADPAKMAYKLPEKPSIAVLPFTNLSDDKQQEYFADGITEDIIIDLSKVSGLFVIARNSTFIYKDKTATIGQVAEALGVRYVLEGSVRRVGDKVRIGVQLIDATTGRHLWAERYDGSLDDIFALQDEVTKNTVAALSVKLTTQDRALQAQIETQSAEAYDIFLRGWAHYRRNTPDDYAKAIPYLVKAVELDPDYRRAYATLAALYWNAFANARLSRGGEWVRSLELSLGDTFARAAENLKRAKLANTVPLAYQVSSGMLMFRGQYAEAETEALRAINLARNDPAGYEALGKVLIFSGNSSNSIDAFRTALRLDPQYSYIYEHWLGLAMFNLERFDDAAVLLAKASQRNPDDERVLIPLAATFGMLGRKQDARRAVDRLNNLRQLKTDDLTSTKLETGTDLFLLGPLTLQDMDLWPFKAQLDRERLREGLRRVGVPASGPSEKESPKILPGATTIDAAMAKKLFDRGVQFVDVRGPSWNLGRIPGATHLFLQKNFSATSLALVAKKDEEIVIYCMGPACLLSSKACGRAISWGYQKIYYFRTGFPAWQAAGYPIEQPD